MPRNAGRADERPVASEFVAVEVVGQREVARHGDVGRRVGGEVGALRDVRDHLAGREDHRPPALGPVDGQHERLSARVVLVAAVRPRAEEDRPPVAGRRLHEVGVAGRGDLERTGGVEIALRQDRPPLPRLIRSHHVPAAEDDDRVVDLRPALGREQVVPPVALENVRSLDPRRLLGQVRPAVDDQAALADHRQRLQVDLLDPDGPVPEVGRLDGGQVRIGDVGPAVVVHEQVRVDAAEGEPDRVGPGPGRVRRRDDAVAVPLGPGREHVERALVMADGGGEDAARDAGPLQGELRGPVEHVPDLGPRHQVAAVPDRDARKGGERGVDEVVVLPDAGHARVRVKPQQHRVEILVRPHLDATKGLVVSDVRE